MATDITTALIYTRVSKEEQARDGLSLGAQLKVCRRYAADHSWSIGTEYQDILSGTKDTRPGYQALLADARVRRSHGQNVVIVVGWLHRLGRRLQERVRCWEELHGLTVPIHSVHEGGIVQEFVANVLAAVAQEEIRQLSERIKATKQSQRESGWPNGGRPPWGYVRRDATPEERAQGAGRAMFDIDPVAGPFAREAFERIANGESLRSVARWVMSLPAEARNNHLWQMQGILRSVKASVYVARATTPVDMPVLERPVCRWPALIPDELYLKARHALDQHKLVPRQASKRFLLTGFIRCHKCDRRMAGNSATKQAIYMCAGCYTGECYGTYSAKAFDSQIIRLVTELLATYSSSDRSIQAFFAKEWNRLAAPDASRSATIIRRRNELERMLSTTRERIGRLALRFADGDIDRVAYDTGREAIEQDIEDAQRELGTLPTTPPPLMLPYAMALRQIRDWYEVFPGADVADQREVLASLIVRVTGKRVPRSSTHARDLYQLSIEWTSMGEHLSGLASRLAA